MKETQLSSVLVKNLRAAMPGSLILKIQDKFTAGIPDVLVFWRGRAAGIEVKLDRAKRKGERSPLQALTLRRLELAGAWAWWLVYWPDGSAVLERPDTAVVAIFKPMPGLNVHVQVARFVADALEGSYGRL